MCASTSKPRGEGRAGLPPAASSTPVASRHASNAMRARTPALRVCDLTSPTPDLGGSSVGKSALQSTGMPRLVVLALGVALLGGVIGRADAAAPAFRIRLERTACFGTCPIYSVTAHRD